MYMVRIFWLAQLKNLQDIQNLRLKGSSTFQNENSGRTGNVLGICLLSVSTEIRDYSAQFHVLNSYNCETPNLV